MEHVLKVIIAILPLAFAFGFLAPVFAEGLELAGISQIFGLGSLTVALIVAGVWGLIATVTGRWI